MYRLTLTAAELEMVKRGLRLAADKDYQKAEGLEVWLDDDGDAELHSLIESYRKDADDADRLANTLFERAEMLDTKEEAKPCSE